MTILNKKYINASDEQLMDWLLNGEKNAFKEIYKRYNRRLIHYFFRMLAGDEEKSQDFLQDIFFKLITKGHTYQSKCTFSTWIFTIAHNMCKNEYRRQNVRKQVDYFKSDDQIFDRSNIPADQKVDQKIFRQAIMKELETMNPLHKSTFLLRYQENLSLKKISEIQGTSEGTIKSRLFYTTKKLADKLKKYNPNIKEDLNNE